MRNQHVVGLADLLTVQEYVRERVDAVEHKAESPADAFNLELPRVQPSIALTGPELADVHSYFRLRHKPSVHEVKFAVPGNSRLDRLCVRRNRGDIAHRLFGRLLPPIPKTPFAIKGNGVRRMKRRRAKYGDCKNRHCDMHSHNVCIISNPGLLHPTCKYNWLSDVYISHTLRFSIKAPFPRRDDADIVSSLLYRRLLVMRNNRQIFA